MDEPVLVCLHRKALEGMQRIYCCPVPASDGEWVVLPETRGAWVRCCTHSYCRVFAAVPGSWQPSPSVSHLEGKWWTQSSTYLLSPPAVAAGLPETPSRLPKRQTREASFHAAPHLQWVLSDVSVFPLFLSFLFCLRDWRVLYEFSWILYELLNCIRLSFWDRW